MNHNRGRNLYTLGDFHLNQQFPSGPIERLPMPDLFEGDPFKKQSYNFNYAEKPATLPTMLNNSEPNQSAEMEQFNVVYSNEDFAPAVSQISRMDEYCRGKSPNLQDFRKKKVTLDSDFMVDQENPSLDGTNAYPSSHSSVFSYESNPHSSVSGAGCNLTKSANARNLLNSSPTGQSFANMENTLETKSSQIIRFPWERELKTTFSPSTTSQDASSSMLRYSQNKKFIESEMKKSKRANTVTFENP